MPKSARINGISMVYDISGPETGPGVVLHHPLATNHTFWDHLTKALSPRYRVLRLDARGHGGSDAPAGPYAFETLARDVVGLMDQVGMRKAGFVGLSMGGMVGQVLGLEHGSRFKCLALCATTSRVPPEAGALWDSRIKTAREQGMSAAIDDTIGRWMSPKAIATKHPAIPGLKEMIRTTPVEGYCGWGGAIRTLNLTDRLSAIKLPTLVISGELDQGTTPAAGEAIHKSIKGSQFVVMKGVAHCFSSEEPELFLGHVRLFLDTHCG
jgi:3-oxoadipate enol-lactonase